jgi:hypothetical protein
MGNEGPWTAREAPRRNPVKIGACIVRHGRYVMFQLAEVAMPRIMFAAVLCRINRLRGPPLAAA